MAFPTIRSYLTTDGTGGNQTTHTVTLPSGTVNGDRVVIAFIVDGNTTVTQPSGWTLLVNFGLPGAASRLALMFHDYITTPPSTVDVLTSASERSGAMAWTITTGTYDTGTDPEFAGLNSGTSTNPDPASWGPAWGADDTLWLIGHGNDRDRTPVTNFPPTDYSSNDAGAGGGGANGVTWAAGNRAVNAATIDPGGWNIDASDQWATFIIANKPAGPPPEQVSVGGVIASGDLTGALTVAVTKSLGPPELYGQNGMLHRISGVLYAVQQEIPGGGTGARQVPQIIRSADEGATWTLPDDHVDNANGAGGECQLFGAANAGGKIAVLWSDENSATGDMVYSSYDTATDTWIRENEVIEAAVGSHGSTDGGAAIGIRPISGEVVVAYEHEASPNWLITIAIRPDVTGAGTFGTPVDLYTQTDNVHAVSLAIDPADDDVHVFWCGWAVNNLYHRRIDGGDDSLGTLNSVAPGGDVRSLQNPGNAAIYHGWLYHSYVVGASGSERLHVRRAAIADVPTWTDETVSTTDINLFGASSTPTQLVVASDQLVAIWVRESDNELMWSLGPFFPSEEASGTTLTATNMISVLAEDGQAGDERLHLMTISGADTGAGTLTDVDAKAAAGDSLGEILENNPFYLPQNNANPTHIKEVPADATRPQTFYFLMGRGSSPWELDFYRSFDALRWHAIGQVTDVTGANSGPADTHLYYDGTIFHILSGHASSDSSTEDGELWYFQFDPDTEVWDVTKQLVSNRIAQTRSRAVSVARGDGTVVCIYEEQVSGSGTNTLLRYRIRTAGGTWGGENTWQAHSGAEQHRLFSAVLGASNRVHVIWQEPADLNDVLHRSISSGDSLDTRNVVHSTTNNTEISLAYNGTVLAVVYEPTTTRSRDIRTATSAANPTWSGANDVDDSAYALIDGASRRVVGLAVLDGNDFAVIKPVGSSPWDIYTDHGTTGAWTTDADSAVNTVASATYLMAALGVLIDGANYILTFNHDPLVEFRISRIPIALGVLETVAVAGVIAANELTGAFGPTKVGLVPAGVISAGQLVGDTTKAITQAPSGVIASGQLEGATTKKTATLFEGTIPNTSLTGALVTILAFFRTFTGLIAVADLTGAFGPSKVAANYEGATTPTGDPNLKTATVYEGATTPAGDLTHRSLKTLAGAITVLTGDLIRKTLKPVAGTITVLTGATTLKFVHLFEGTIGTLTGELIRKTKKLLEGTLTSSGFSDHILVIIQIAIGGAITSAGALTLKTAHLLEGATSSSGALVRKTSTLMEGAITTITGNLDIGLAFFRTFTGAIGTLTGQLIRKTQTTPSGATAPTGSLIKRIATLAEGTITPTGFSDHVITFFARTFTGAVTLAGALIRQPQTTQTGQTTPAGAYGPSAITKLLEGATTPSGALAATRTAVVALSGAISTLTGALIRKTATTMTASLGSSGQLRRHTAQNIGGAITPSGDLRRKTRLIIGGALTLAGAAAHVFIPQAVAGPISRIIRHQGSTSREIRHQGSTGGTL